MTVALVVAVLVAVVALVGLLLQRRALTACRTQLHGVELRLHAADVALGEAQGAASSAEEQARSHAAAHEAAARTAEERREALTASEQRLRQAEAELERRAEGAAKAGEELAAATARAARSEAAADVEQARGAELAAALAVAEQRATEGDSALARAEEEHRALRRRVDELQVGAAAAATGPSDAVPAGTSTVVEASWRLLLARVERQWASSVGAGEDERGVVRAHPDEQLHQAVARELERLREEVGLHTEVTRTGAMHGVHPLLVLLAAGELTALVAPHSERVAVELGDRLVVVGEGWDPGPADGEHLRASVSDTGLDGEVVSAGETVRIVLAPRQVGAASSA